VRLPSGKHPRRSEGLRCRPARSEEPVPGLHQRSRQQVSRSKECQAFEIGVDMRDGQGVWV
jgi:hypothetical protein